MPFTVITLSKVPASLRGDLSKWMQEIDTGVYIGNFNSRVREHLWQRVIKNIGQGQASLSYQAQNELGYKFETFNTQRIKVDYDGLQLVMFPADEDITDELSPGFSKASSFHKARKFSSRTVAQSEKPVGESDAANCVEGKILAHTCQDIPYIVLDLETDGLDPIHDRIIEIGAVKLGPHAPEIFQRLILHDAQLPPSIVSLTKISDELLKNNGVAIQEAMEGFLAFIGELPIVGYGVDFDFNFINAYMSRQGLPALSNQRLDVMQLVKREKMFLPNYKLETVLKAYGIEPAVQHRALEDAKMTSVLASKVNKFYDYLRIKADQ
ncbi:MAG: type I-E CRISPR-associated endoribonuclease Cas2e [Eubacteriales bacterium]|nr:type I-E CRISPR-associated endoribonuclease Cas2e [Clostridiales bacterium]MDY5835500.1 type I-E CRISPR-associated endoribonuclease Cas2e [Eubacteriales bacterium]